MICKEIEEYPPSYFSDFRDHILTQFDIDYETNPDVNCQSLNVLFLVRHNYVAHPRNPTGKISRKLANEQQVLDDLKVKFSKHSNVNFTWNHFEELGINEQLKIIIGTDIFVSIHGGWINACTILKIKSCTY